MIYPILNINITGSFTNEHQALDLGWTNTPNEELLACNDGVVENVYTITDGGNTILIDYQNGFKSWFMHCSKIICKIGDRVTKKQLVAYMGSTGTQVTGPHCHFILSYNGTRVNPIDYCYIEPWQKISSRTEKYPVKYIQVDIPPIDTNPPPIEKPINTENNQNNEDIVKHKNELIRNILQFLSRLFKTIFHIKGE